MNPDLIGWLGAACLALCGLPQAWASIRQGHSHGITWGMLVLWGVGEVLTLAYVFPMMDLPLIANYAANTVLVGIIVYYKWRPRCQ